MKKMGKQNTSMMDESAGLAQALISCTGAGIYIVQDGKFQYVNSLFQEMTGYAEQELRDIRPLGLVHSDDRELVRKKATENLKDHSLLPYEYRFLKKNGEVMWVLERLASIEYVGKRATVGSLVDITERKEAEVELELRSQLLDSATDSIFVHDFEGNFIYVNETACRSHGYSREEFMKLKLQDIIIQERPSGALESDFQEMNGGEAVVEAVHRRKDGSLMPVEVHGRSIKADGGKLLLVVVRDITQRKQAQEALAKSEERYRTVLDQMEDAYYEVDLAGNITFCNDVTCRQLGYTREEFMGMNYRDYTSEEDRQRVYRAFNHVYKTGKPVKAFPAVRIRKDGIPISTETSAFPLLSEAGEVIGFRGVSRDVTERAMMIKALSESEERYRNILAEMQEGYYEVDIAGNLTFVNEATCRQLGYTGEDLIGMSYKAYVHKDDQKDVYKAWNKVYRTGKPLKSFSFTCIRKDGTKMLSESSISALRDNKGEIIGFRSISRDVTKRK